MVSCSSMKRLIYNQFIYYLRRWKLLERHYEDNADYQAVYIALLKAFKELETNDQKLIYNHYYKTVHIREKVAPVRRIDYPLELYSVQFEERVPRSNKKGTREHV